MCIRDRYDDPIFLKTAETIFTKARAKGIGAGIHAWGDTASQARFVNIGANLLIHKADIIFFKNGVRDELTDIRSKLGLQPIDTATGEVNI